MSLVKCKEDPSISVSGGEVVPSLTKEDVVANHTYIHTAVSFIINYEVSHYAYFNVDTFVTKYSYSTTYTWS